MPRYQSLLRAAAIAALLLALSGSPASAHYLFVTVAPVGEHGTTKIYYEGGPAAGDGRYLEHYLDDGRTWIRTVESPQPKLLDVADTKQGGKRWLEAPLPSAGPRAVESRFEFGVYRYGKTDVLLNYYGKNLDVSSAEHLDKLARAEKLALDIVPRANDGEIELTVLWRGEPAAGRPVYLRGPARLKKNLTTDERGTVRFTPEQPGRYVLRTYQVEPNEKGTNDGKEYTEVRHHSTLLLKLPLRPE